MMKSQIDSLEKAVTRYKNVKKSYFDSLQGALAEFEALGATAKALRFFDSEQHLKHVEEPASLLRIEVATAIAQSKDGQTLNVS